MLNVHVDVGVTTLEQFVSYPQLKLYLKLRLECYSIRERDKSHLDKIPNENVPPTKASLINSPLDKALLGN